MGDWSDPDTDVLADFRAFCAAAALAPLQPWQEQMIEAALQGKPLMLTGGRLAGRSAASEVWRKYTSGKGVKGCHTPAQESQSAKVYREMRARDPYTVILDEALDLHARDEAWIREYFGRWEEAEPDIPWTHPPDLSDAPQPSPEFDALDLCVLGVSPVDHLAPPRVRTLGVPV